MKGYLDKGRKGIIVFIIGLMTMGIISSEIIYANEEDEPRIEESIGNDESENVDKSFNQESNSSVDPDIEKDTEETLQIHMHSDEMVNSEELEITDDEFFEEVSFTEANSELEENTEKTSRNRR